MQSRDAREIAQVSARREGGGVGGGRWAVGRENSRARNSQLHWNPTGTPAEKRMGIGFTPSVPVNFTRFQSVCSQYYTRNRAFIFPLLPHIKEGKPPPSASPCPHLFPPRAPPPLHACPCSSSLLLAAAPGAMRPLTHGRLRCAEPCTGMRRTIRSAELRRRRTSWR